MGDSEKVLTFYQDLPGDFNDSFPTKQGEMRDLHCKYFLMSYPAVKIRGFPKQRNHIVVLVLNEGKTDGSTLKFVVLFSIACSEKVKDGRLFLQIHPMIQCDTQETWYHGSNIELNQGDTAVLSE